MSLCKSVHTYTKCRVLHCRGGQEAEGKGGHTDEMGNGWTIQLIGDDFGFPAYMFNALCC